jgi:exonuclease VII small subunit
MNIQKRKSNKISDIEKKIKDIEAKDAKIEKFKKRYEDLMAPLQEALTKIKNKLDETNAIFEKAINTKKQTEEGIN